MRVARSVRHVITLCLLLCAHALALPGATSHAAELPIDSHGPHALEGPWEFHWQTFLSPAEPRSPPPDARLTLPSSWTQVELDGRYLPPEGHASYRLTLDLGENRPESLLLRVPLVYSSYRLYVDGREVARVGEPAASADAAQPDYGERKVWIDRPGQTIDILLHVSNYSSRVAGIPRAIEIGTPEAVQGLWAIELISTSALAGGLMLIGLSQLILFLIRRRERAYLFFGLTVIFWSLQTTLSAQLLEAMGLHIPIALARPLDGFSALAAGTSYLWFLSALFPRELPPRLTRWVAVPVTVYVLIAVIDPGLTRSVAIGWLLYLVVALLALALLALVQAVRRNRPDAGLILLGSGIVALTAALQIYWFNEAGVRDAVASVGVLAAMGLHSLALARRNARAFERSQRLETALRRANRLKDEFLANTSHELRTPLHAMIGLAESLPREDSKTRQGLDLIIQSGRRLARLVDDTISFTQLKHGELPIRRQPTAVAPLVERVMATCQPLLGSRSVVLESRLDEPLPPILADADRLYQVLFNLIGNAIKFTDKGRILVSARREGDRVCFAVEDTGIGIAAEELDRMQRPYEQGHDSSLDGRGGFGLGLAISRALLERHQSELELHSQTGVGTTIRFRLPISDRDEAAAPTPILQTTGPGPVAASEGDAIETAPRHGDVTTILIVDDDATAAIVLEEQLHQAGYRTLVAHSGTEALELVSRHRVELVLLDVMMPDMSGLTVCRRLREEFDANTLPIILVTARTRPEDVIEGLEAGANDHLSKPFWRREMLARVEAHLRVHENEQMRWALQEKGVAPTDNESDDPRVLLVKLLECAVTLWQAQTGTGRAELAEKSRLWTVTLDGSARKTRTLDRYLNPETLPKRPRWGVVVRTARFVFDHLESDTDRDTLRRRIECFERMLPR
ncbi:response regulator [Guyparkeria hydrothermalis]|uniref:response regulator n=1 Tax=Guyparkeria hydrothermalis TaxID=923 RepID=UPI002021D17E|nr:response regulator [Guyparkeria hydrothermalis]MCL7751444.1 response regulator [Guyparkeria hydrothermalis]